MATEHWKRLRGVLEQALERPTDERAVFLDEACADDEALRADVERLLAEETRDASDDSGFLEPPSAAEVERTLGPEPGQGARVGSFRLVRKLGSGGMGTVWEAEQDQPRRRVALKLLAPGVASASNRKRFEFESEILARLQHAGIAQVYEVGIHDMDGMEVPYFAMEPVEDARSLDVWAREHDLDVPARLELFRKVCDAVHHGHTKGVVHRDLKPGNILVDASGQPKVIDFGIARAADAATEGFATRTGQILGTLQYMSPEQLSGDPDGVDAHSDVYSLGVVLYQLLTGQLPYEAETASLGEIARLVQDRPPRRPSSLARELRGDLEVVLLKALEKEPGRRYASAAALADDLRRVQHRLPVVARPPSAFYQARMFARRHRVIVAAACVVALALVAATIISINFALDEQRAASEAQRAEQTASEAAAAAAAAELEARTERDNAMAARDAETAARQEAERLLAGALELSTSFLSDFFDRVRDLQGSPAMTRQLLTSVLDHLDSLDPADPEVRYLRASVLLRLGSVTGGGGASNLGAHDEGKRMYDEALELARGLHAEDPDDVRFIGHTADAHLAQAGWLNNAGRSVEALDHAVSGLELWTTLTERVPRNLMYHLRRGSALQSVAVALAHTQGDEAAAPWVAQWLELGEWLVEQAPGDPLFRHALAAALNVHADNILRGNVHAADEARARESALLEVLVDEYPSDDAYRSALGRSIEWRSNYAMRLGNDVLAERFAERSVEIYEELVSRTPGDERFPRQLGYSLFNLGEVHHMRAVTLGDEGEDLAAHWRRARGYYERSLGLFERLRDEGRLMGGDVGLPADIQGFIDMARRGEAEARPTE